MTPPLAPNAFDLGVDMLNTEEAMETLSDAVMRFEQVGH